MEASVNPIYPESDPRHHTAKVKRALEQVIDDLRENTMLFDDPKAQTLFETSASVLEGLRQAFDEFETHTDTAIRL